MIRAKKAAVRAQASSSNIRAKPRTVTQYSTLQPNFAPAAKVVQESSSAPAIETVPSDLALGK